MPRTATCTSCWQRVTVPDGLEGSDLVRCPLCGAEYPLPEVLDDAAEQAEEGERPAELVPVAAVSAEGASEESSETDEEPAAGSEAADQEVEETPDDTPEPAEEQPEATEEAGEPPQQTIASVDEAEPPTGEEVGPADEAEQPAEEAEEPSEEVEESVEATKASSDETPPSTTQIEEPAGEAPQPVDEDTIVQVRCPCCEAEYRLSEVIIAGTGAPLGPVAAAAVSREGLPREAAPSEAAESPESAAFLDVWGKVESAPQIDVGTGAATDADGAAVDARAFDFEDQESLAADRAAGVAGARPRPGRKEKSLLRELTSWVLGGVVGLLIAYYILNWIKGEQGNFLKIPLPGVPHTYKYSPDWFPRWLKPASESEEATPDEVAESGPSHGALAPDSRQQGAGLADPRADRDEEDGSPSAMESPMPARQETFPSGYVGLVEPPVYTSDELAEALGAFEESAGEPSEAISLEDYARFCRLAEVITFAEGSPDDGQQRSAVRALCEQVASNPSNLDKIGFRAGALCVGQHRRGNGILLAGTVLKTISEGNAHGTQVQLAASAQTVLVAGDSPLPANEDDSVVILGSIVDDPAENLVGFTTKQPFVIWAGMTIKVE